MKMFAAGLATVLFIGTAIAGPSQRKTKITFNEAVRAPGITLTAGTYYFTAPNFSNNRTLVRIEDENGNLKTQFMGIADDYAGKPPHDFIVFGAHDCPKAIKSWFYPPTGQGVRFVYSPEEATSIVNSCDDSVPETSAKTFDVSKIYGYTVNLMTPQKQEQAYKPDALKSSDQQDRNGFDAQQ